MSLTLAQGQSLQVRAPVTYVAAPLAYIDAGRDAGLAQDDTIHFFRQTEPAGTGVVVAVSKKSSAVRITDTLSIIQAGFIAVGSVRPLLTESPPAVRTEPSDSSEVIVPRTVTVPEPAVNVFSGRIGLQYVGISSSDNRLEYRQPALTMRMTVGKIFGTDFTLNTYSRSLYDVSDPLGRFGTSSRFQMRMYELSVQYDRPGSPLGLVVGRTTPFFLGSVGTFDGGILSYRFGAFRAGLAAGARSYRRDTSFDGDDLLGGVFVQYQSPVESMWRYEGSVAFTEQLYEGATDREFFALQNFITYDTRFSVYHSAEIEINTINRGIRSRSLSLSSSYLSAYYYPLGWLQFNAGYDVSRSVYLFTSMKSIPDTVFGRDYLHGFRFGSTLRLPLRFSLSLNGTYRTQRDSPRDSYSVGAQVRAIDLLRSEGNAAVRYTSITGVVTQGGVWSFDIDRSVGRDLSLLFRAERYAYSLILTGSRLRTSTLSLSANYRISDLLFFIGTFDRVWETAAASTRFYVELGVRF